MLLWASSQVTAMLFAANKFWEEERESLSKEKLYLGEGQCTEMHFWPKLRVKNVFYTERSLQ